MGAEQNVQTVKDFFAAIGGGDKEGLLALVAEDLEIGRASCRERV